MEGASYSYHDNGGAPFNYMELNMIGYKLFRKRKDGTLGPLFINRKQRLVPNTFYFAEAHHVWAKVEFDPMDIIKRPDSQGGTWYLGTWINILEVYDEAEELCSEECTA